MVRYLDHVGVVGVVADDTTGLAAAYRQNPQQPAALPRPRLRGAGLRRRRRRPAGEYPYRHPAADIVASIHSSGTTGIPKSTMLGHRSVLGGKQPRMTRFPVEPYDRLMSLMPHTHAGGLSYFLTATLLGCRPSSWATGGGRRWSRSWRPFSPR